MINELLEFTRGSSRALALELTDYREFVAELMKEITPEASGKCVKIKCEKPPPPVLLALDRGRLLRVFYNLINNAIDVMPGAGTVMLRFGVWDGEVGTEVGDTGPGLAPEIEPRLFQPLKPPGLRLMFRWVSRSCGMTGSPTTDLTGLAGKWVIRGRARRAASVPMP